MKFRLLFVNVSCNFIKDFVVYKNGTADKSWDLAETVGQADPKFTADLKSFNLKNFLEQYIRLDGLPQTIRTDKGTAITGKEIRDLCKSLDIKLIYGTSYIHTPTGRIE